MNFFPALQSSTILRLILEISSVPNSIICSSVKVVAFLNIPTNAENLGFFEASIAASKISHL